MLLLQQVALDRCSIECTQRPFNVLCPSSQVKKKLLLIQFRFNGCTVKVKRNHVEGYTLDKYLTLDTWSQIYTKLTNTIDVYAANDTIKPDPSSIKMTRAQLSLRVSWSAVDPMHRQLADASDVDVAQLCPMVMNVDVTMLSLIDKYKTVRQSEKKPEPGASSTVSASNSTSSIASADSALSAASAASSAPKSTAAKKTTTRTYSNLKLAGSIDDDEEYVPTANATAANGVQYTPSTVNAASDEYMPPTSAEVDVVTYTPTKITKSRSDEGASRRAPAASHSTTDLNRNDCVNKRSRPPSKVDAMADLFGDSEDEVARCTRSAKKTTRGDGVTQRKRPNGGPASVKTQSNLSNWLGIKEEPKKRRIEANGAADAPPKTANSDATEWERLKSISDKLDRKIESSRRTVEALYVALATAVFVRRWCRPDSLVLTRFCLVVFVAEI